MSGVCGMKFKKFIGKVADRLGESADNIKEAYDERQERKMEKQDREDEMNELPFCTRCRQNRTSNPTLICSDCQENNN
jgi:hypothetical protein